MEQSEKPEEEKKKANTVLYIALAIIVILAIALFTNGFGLFSHKKVTANIPLEIDDSPVLGNVSANVTIYEFSDFSCPFCAAADNSNQEYISALESKDPNWQAPIPFIISNYVNTGKVKLVYKYYPGHGSGKAAEVVGFALKDQSEDLFWKFHDLAFANQNDVSDLVKMKAIAQQLGANMTQLTNDIDSGKYDAQLTNDTNMGISNGVTGTPSFFVNGQLIEGAQSAAYFKTVIDKALE